MRETAWVLAVTLLLGGCGPEDEQEEFLYGESDIEALVVGTWSGAWRATPGSTARFTLDVTRAALPESHAACASRTFAAASASDGPGQRVTCGSMSSMNLEAVLAVDDGSLEPTSLRGDVMIAGLELRNAALTLSDGSLELWASWHEGSWQQCRATERSNGAAVAECTLDSRLP